MCLIDIYLCKYLWRERDVVRALLCRWSMHVKTQGAAFSNWFEWVRETGLTWKKDPLIDTWSYMCQWNFKQGGKSLFLQLKKEKDKKEDMDMLGSCVWECMCLQVPMMALCILWTVFFQPLIMCKLWLCIKEGSLLRQTLHTASVPAQMSEIIVISWQNRWHLPSVWLCFQLHTEGNDPKEAVNRNKIRYSN